MGGGPEVGRPSGRAHLCGQGGTFRAATGLLHGGVLAGCAMALGRGCAPVAVEAPALPAGPHVLGLPEALAGHPVIQLSYVRRGLCTQMSTERNSKDTED